MRISLAYVGYLHLPGVKNNSVLEVDEPSSVADVLEHFGMRREHRRFLVPVVNGERKRLSYVLRPDDALFLYLPAGGG